MLVLTYILTLSHFRLRSWSVILGLDNLKNLEWFQEFVTWLTYMTENEYLLDKWPFFVAPKLKC